MFHFNYTLFLTFEVQFASSQYDTEHHETPQVTTSTAQIKIFSCLVFPEVRTGVQNKSDSRDKAKVLYLLYQTNISLYSSNRINI